MGLYSKGLVYGGKFAFQNRLGYSLSVGGKFTVFALLYFVFEGNFQVQAPPRGGGGYLIHGGAFFRDFSVRPEMYAMAMMASGKKIARGLVKIYKRLQEVLPLSGEIDKNGESDEKGESGENYSHGFGFGQYSN